MKLWKRAPSGKGILPLTRVERDPHRQVAIYVLHARADACDIFDPMYVGQSVDPKRRLYKHLSSWGCHNRDLAKRIKAARGVVMTVVEWCDAIDANTRERYWINRVIAMGANPANIQR